MSYNLNINNTTMFLVPPLGVSKAKLKEQGFVGAYLKDTNRPDIIYDRAIFMLFRPSNMSLFNEWLEEECGRTPQIVDEYDYAGGYVVLVYVLEETFADDFEKFLKGQYSKFSAEFKNRFAKTVRTGNIGKGKEEVSWQWRIFKRDPEIKKHWEESLDVRIDTFSEVWSVPSIDDETLNISKLRGVKELPFAKEE